MFYSNRLGDIPDPALQAALDRFHLGTLLGTDRVPFGLFGQNVFISSTAGQFVFRGAPHYPWQLPTEAHFADDIHEQTDVPVPWPYHHSADSDPFPWPWGYAIMPRLPGLLLADQEVYGSLSVRQRTALARAEGDLLWRLQRVTLPVPGTYDVDTGQIRQYQEGYVNRVVDRVLANEAAAFGNDGHGERDRSWLRDLVESWRGLPPPATWSVVHEDFGRNNMTGVFDGDNATITGLVDLMTCHYGDGLADLARQFSILLSEPDGERLASEYVGAYLARRGSLEDSERQRTLLYLIDERMLAWEYARRPGNEGLGWWDLSIPLRAWLEPYLDTWSAIVSG